MYCSREYSMTSTLIQQYEKSTLKVNRDFKHSSPPKPTISQEELKALKNKSQVILTIDKGVTMVVINKQDYTSKMENLSEQNDTRRTRTTKPPKHKAKLINLLKSIKVEGRLRDSTHKRMYPTGVAPPNFWGLP